ncbi:MAG: hypothetical protein JWN17_397, partial [Frankiales bacterium]|nr:hypothetical protein [Frankiales bacterium]
AAARAAHAAPRTTTTDVPASATGRTVDRAGLADLLSGWAVLGATG